MLQDASQNNPQWPAADEIPPIGNLSADNVEMADVAMPDAFDPPLPEFDPPCFSLLPLMDRGLSEKLDMRAQVEQVDDEGAGDQTQWVEDYPGPAGTAGQPACSYFEEVQAEQEQNGLEP